MHNSRPAARLVPAPAYYQLWCREHGTRVRIENLFGNMPVRVKQRSSEYADGKEVERQLEILRKQVAAVLLAWGRPINIRISVSGGVRKIHVNVKNSFCDQSIDFSDGLPAFDIQLVRSILSQATYINPSDWDTWVKVSARTSSVTVEGAISLQPAPSKQVQFVSLGILPIDHSSGGSVLHDEVNSLFSFSDFGAEEKVRSMQEENPSALNRRRKQDGCTNKQSQGSGKGVDRWPMFYVRITVQEDKIRPFERREQLMTQEGILSAVIKVLKALVNSFLEDNHFQNRRRLSTRRQRVKDDCTPAPHGPSPRMKVSRDNGHPGKGSLHLRNAIIEAGGNAKVEQCSSRPANSSRHNSSTDSILQSGSLGTHIKIPESLGQRVMSVNDTFSCWSRIKSGKRNALEELLSKPPSLPLRLQQDGLRSDVATKLIRNETAAGGIDSSESIEANSAAEAKLNDQIDQGTDKVASDETVSWTNPISKATVRINSRTGMATTRLLKQSNLTSLDESRSFQSQARITRLPSLSTKTRGSPHPVASRATGPWVRDLLEAWVNPIFSRTEEPVPQLCFSAPHLDAGTVLHGMSHHYLHTDIQSAFIQSSSTFSTKLSKEKLQAARVLAQVEKKFILVSMSASASRRIANDKEPEEQLLVLIDQHAADERVRVEGLLAELCTPISSSHDLVSSTVGTQNFQSPVATTKLPEPIMFEVLAQEQRLYRIHAGYFAKWGVLFDLIPMEPYSREPLQNQCRIFVKALPEAIAERCRLDPKLLIQLIRSELWRRKDFDECPHGTLNDAPATSVNIPGTSKNEWFSRIHDCPPGIIDMVNSRACRSAIMFNDVLTKEECTTLVQTLATCAFPFQCAHGRPSMIPLVDLAATTGPSVASTAFRTRRAAASRADQELTFDQAWTKWKHSGGYMDN